MAIDPETEYGMLYRCPNCDRANSFAVKKGTKAEPYLEHTCQYCEVRGKVFRYPPRTLK